MTFWKSETLLGRQTVLGLVWREVEAKKFGHECLVTKVLTCHPSRTLTITS